MKNVVCKACGAEIPYGARFCSECGNKIVIEPNINPDGIHKTVETQRARKGFVKKLQVKRDLELILPEIKARKIPLIIGSAGGSGSAAKK